MKARAARGNPQPPVRVKFEHYLTPSYTEAGITYKQNVREMSCDCPHWQRNHDRGHPITCKHLQNAVIAAHFEAIEIARTCSTAQLASLSMKYQHHLHIRDACLFVIWERERDLGHDQPGYQEFVARIGELEGEIKELVEERLTVAAPATFSQSIAADLGAPQPMLDAGPPRETEAQLEERLMRDARIKAERNGNDVELEYARLLAQHYEALHDEEERTARRERRREEQTWEENRRRRSQEETENNARHHDRYLASH